MNTVTMAAPEDDEGLHCPFAPVDPLDDELWWSTLLAARKDMYDGLYCYGCNPPCRASSVAYGDGVPTATGWWISPRPEQGGGHREHAEQRRLGTGRCVHRRARG